MKYLQITLSLCLVLLTGWNVSSASAQSAQDQGVYEYVVRAADGSIDSITNAVQDALVGAGWEIVAHVTPGAPASCSYAASVVIAHRPAYGNVVMRANNATGPFGVLDRINIFEDEDGVHVSIVNQRNIIRTVLMNDTGYADFVEQHVTGLRTAILDAVTGSESVRQYGQVRSKGYIGRTMGVMAGGRFDGRVKDIALLQGRSLNEVANLVEQGLRRPGEKWGTGLSFRVDLAEYQTVLFGTTGTPLDSKSFEIVGAGGDSERDGFACPGLAHAGAYPIELVVTATDDGVAIRMVDAMYRMKMYFEDAGKIAFMKNMTMPGSIAGELENKCEMAGA